jgi:broad specificity phosphatase PhoE
MPDSFIADAPATDSFLPDTGGDLAAPPPVERIPGMGQLGALPGVPRPTFDVQPESLKTAIGRSAAEVAPSVLGPAITTARRLTYMPKPTPPPDTTPTEPTIGPAKPSVLNVVRQGALGRLFGEPESTAQAFLPEGQTNPNLLRFEAAVPTSAPPEVKAASEFVSGLTSPENAMIMGATSGLGALGGELGSATAGKLVSMGFSAQMLHDSYNQLKAAGVAAQQGDWDTARRLATHGTLATVMAALGLKHTIGAEPAAPVATPSMIREARKPYGAEPPAAPASPGISAPPTIGLPPETRGDLATPAAAEQPAPVPAPPPSRVDRVTQFTPNPPTAAIPTAPESPATYQAQVDQLNSGQRRVVMLPKGEMWRPATYPVNVQLMSDAFGNVYIYRPDLISRNAIRKAAKNNTLPEVLGSTEMGMGAPDKSNLRGTPVVVSGKAADGTEVQSTATDQATLPATVAATQRVTPPGGSVEVTTPEQAVGERAAPVSNDTVQPVPGAATAERAGAPVAGMPIPPAEGRTPLVSEEPQPAEREVIQPASTSPAGAPLPEEKGAPAGAPSSAEFFRGAWNVGLTQKGLEDARKVASRTAGQFTEIHSSPLDRALDTADAVAATNPQAGPMRPVDALEPWTIGQHEGEGVTPDRLADLERRVRENPDGPIPGAGKFSGKPGESFNDFKDPLIAHVQEQLKRLQPGDRILNVTHYRDIQALKAWEAADHPADGSIDADVMTEKGAQRPGELFRLDPATGKIEEVQDASKDGIYFLRHGETEANDTNGAIPKEIRAAEPSVTLGSGLGALQTPVENLYKQDIAPKAKTVGAGLVQAWDTLKKITNPVSRGESAKFTGLSMREHMADRQRAYDIAAKAMEPAYKMFDRVAGQALGGDEPSRRYVTSFIDRIERGDKDPDPAMQQASDVFRQILDERREKVQEADPKALQNYIENYFPHIWKDPAKAKSVIDQIIADYMGKRPMEGNTSWKKMRSIPFFEEGIKRGLEPVSWNPVDLVTQRVIQMDKYVMAHRVFNDMDEAGLLKYVPVGEKAPEGYAQIDDRIATVYGPKQGAVAFPENERAKVWDPETNKYKWLEPSDVTVFGRREMGKYWAPEPAARVINNHLSPGLRSNELVGPLYRQWIGASNWLNQFQLGFSLFHAGFTSVDATVSKFALGLKQLSHGDVGKAAKSFAQTPLSFLTQPFGIGDKLVKEWEAPGSQGDAIGALVEAMKAGGWRAHMDQMYKTRITQNMVEAWRAGNPLGAALRLPFAAVEQSVRPVLEWLVPRQKAAVVADLVRYEMERNPNMTHEQLREVAAKAADSADNRMGQLAYDNLFWNKTLKDLAMASTRSVGWNLGTLRELGGGLLDLRKLASSKPELTYRASYLVALPIVVGSLGAMMNYAMTGKGPQELKDYFFPRTGRLDEYGNPERVSLPSYMKDIYHYTQEPGKTIKNKMHPALNLVAEMLENKDYYGAQIRNEDDPFMRQIADTAKFAGKSLEPFSLRGAQRQSRLGGSPLVNFAANFVGVTPAPNSINQTPAERLANEYRESHRETGSRTQEQGERSKARADVIRAMRLGENPVPLVRQYIQEGKLSTQEFGRLRQAARETPLQSAVKNLPLPEALNVYDKATDEERQSLNRTVRGKVFLARQKPWEWTGKAPELATKYFGVKPPRARAADISAPPGY